jgi:hypothetical protein
MQKRTLREKKIEEKKIFWNSLVESNDGNKEKSMLDFQFFERCLNIQRTRSLMPKVYGSRKGYQTALENMCDLAVQEYDEHGFEI